MSIEPVAEPSPSPGGLDRLIDEVARRASTVAARVARTLTLVAVLAALGGVAVWVALGGALVDEGGDWQWGALALAVACLIPVALVLRNRHRLARLGRQEDELGDALRGLVGSLRDQAVAVTRLGELRDELGARRGGLRGLLDVARVLRRWSAAGRDVANRSSTLAEAFGLVGFTGLVVCAISLAALAVAVPVAIVAGSVVWAT